MAPHVEAHTGKYRGTIGGLEGESNVGAIYKAVDGTAHRTGDVTSPEAMKAHKLLESDPDNYREVDDKLGIRCDQTPRNPLVDDVD